MFNLDLLIKGFNFVKGKLTKEDPEEVHAKERAELDKELYPEIPYGFFEQDPTIL